MEEVEVIKNDFIKEDDLEQSLRAATDMKRGGNTFQRVLVDGKNSGYLKNLLFSRDKVRDGK